MTSTGTWVTGKSQEWLKRHVDKIEEAKLIRREVEQYEVEHPGLPYFVLKDNKDSAIVELVGGFGKLVLQIQNQDRPKRNINTSSS